MLSFSLFSSNLAPSQSIQGSSFCHELCFSWLSHCTENMRWHINFNSQTFLSILFSRIHKTILKGSVQRFFSKKGRCEKTQPNYLAHEPMSSLQCFSHIPLWNHLPGGLSLPSCAGFLGPLVNTPSVFQLLLSCLLPSVSRWEEPSMTQCLLPSLSLVRGS